MELMNCCLKIRWIEVLTMQARQSQLTVVPV